MNTLAGLLPVFAETVLPVILVALAGWLLARSMEVEGRTLGRVLFYLTTPMLVFRSLYQMQVTASTVRNTLIVAVVVMVGTAVLGWLAAYDLERRERAAITMTSGISNNGNMGLPLCLFAFGPAGLSLGTVYYVVSSFMTNTVGSVIASAGTLPIGSAIAQIMRVPVLYAAILGLTFNRMAWSLPVGVFRAVDLLAGAAVPLMLVMLGVQLRSVTRLEPMPGLWRSTVVRLLGAPVLALGVCALLGVAGMERNVLILQASMPTAVITSVIATEYDTAPRLVAMVILTTTLISMVTLSVILTMML